MSKAINIKPCFWLIKEINELSIQARYLLIGMWSSSDKNNLIERNLYKIKYEILGGSGIKETEISKMIEELLKSGLVKESEKDGREMLFIALSHLIDAYPKRNNSAVKQAIVAETAQTLRKHRQEAGEIIDFLNEKTGFSYTKHDSNIMPIMNLLREGIERWDFNSIIAVKCKEWASDPIMNKFLRPSTLFRRSNFLQYLGQLEKN